MNRTQIPDERGFPVSGHLLQTFGHPPAFFEVSGPGALVRLVQQAKVTYDGLQLADSRRDGLFWFEETLLRRLCREARSDLRRQQAERRHAFATPLRSLVSLYVRHCLRANLAICKDWTNDFDGFVRLELAAEDRLIALIGPVRRQPAYSATHPQHAAVVANQIWIEGQARQHVIDFGFAPNRSLAKRISGPHPFI